VDKNLIRSVIVGKFGTQCVAARALGLHESRLSRLINGHEKIKPEERKIFQEQLGLKIEEGGVMSDNNAFTMKVAGRAAPPDMTAAQYLARIINAEIKRRGGQVRAVLTFRCEGGKSDGVLLTGWFPVYPNLAAHHKFARTYRIAVDRELLVDEEISLQAFVGKLFIIEAGFRKTNGKNHTTEDSTRRKDTDDFLRVHEVISLADSTTVTNDIRNEQRTRPRARRVVKLASRGVEEDE
jgi:hypothetical protein